MPFDFASAPFESRRAFWQLLSMAPEEQQKRLSELLWAVVFKNELPDFVQEIAGKFVGAEIATTNIGTTWSKTFDYGGFISSSPGVLVVPEGAAGMYSIVVEGFDASVTYQTAPYAHVSTAMKINGNTIWDVQTGYSAVQNLGDNFRRHIAPVHHTRFVGLQVGDQVSVTLSRVNLPNPSERSDFRLTVHRLGALNA